MHSTSQAPDLDTLAIFGHENSGKTYFLHRMLASAFSPMTDLILVNTVDSLTTAGKFCERVRDMHGADAEVPVIRLAAAGDGALDPFRVIGDPDIAAYMATQILLSPISNPSNEVQQKVSEAMSLAAADGVTSIGEALTFFNAEDQRTAEILLEVECNEGDLMRLAVAWEPTDELIIPSGPVVFTFEGINRGRLNPALEGHADTDALLALTAWLAGMSRLPTPGWAGQVTAIDLLHGSDTVKEVMHRITSSYGQNSLLAYTTDHANWVEGTMAKSVAAFSMDQHTDWEDLIHVLDLMDEDPTSPFWGALTRTPAVPGVGVYKQPGEEPIDLLIKDS